MHYGPAIDSYFVSRCQDVRRVLTDQQAFDTETLRARAEPVMRGRVLAQMNGAEHPPSGRSSCGPSPARRYRETGLSPRGPVSLPLDFTPLRAP
ncbi:hypothetical protein [Streptomyces sp. WAC06614]|uniref:hypothetical protein n=1 Tax=Streptomyces sp. WAC06614 TaxID=2487416 RepID=UPI00163C3BAB|nr:hypothetical protein [Streptomyces sp. WAC06614]